MARAVKLVPFFCAFFLPFLPFFYMSGRGHLLDYQEEKEMAFRPQPPTKGVNDDKWSKRLISYLDSK